MILALVLLALGAPAGSRPPAPGELVALGPSDLRVTSGALVPSGDLLRIEVPRVRAVAAWPSPVAELHFRYLGPTAASVPLASGAQRRQIGLKLRAQDTCNVLYVMWRIEPVSGLVVSLKRNPGQHTHAACGTRGYRTLAPSFTGAPPPAAPEAMRTMRTEIRGEELTVQIDGVAVWRGRLPPEALSIDGPPGLRSDNGRFELRLRATGSRSSPAGAARSAPPPRRR